MNNILFLDCDGVLNHEAWYKSDNYYNNKFIDPDIDPAIVERLNNLTSGTNTQIVISSSWKVDDYCIMRLEKAGVKNIVDITPTFIFIAGDSYCRGMEIQAWLENNICNNYVIVDDIYDFYENQRNHTLIVDYQLGLTDDDCMVLKNMLTANVFDN